MMKDKMVTMKIDPKTREYINVLKDADINISAFMRRAIEEKALEIKSAKQSKEKGE